MMIRISSNYWLHPIDQGLNHGQIVLTDYFLGERFSIKHHQISWWTEEFLLKNYVQTVKFLHRSTNTVKTTVALTVKKQTFIRIDTGEVTLLFRLLVEELGLQIQQRHWYIFKWKGHPEFCLCKYPQQHINNDLTNVLIPVNTHAHTQRAVESKKTIVQVRFRYNLNYGCPIKEESKILNEGQD